MLIWITKRIHFLEGKPHYKFEYYMNAGCKSLVLYHMFAQQIIHEALSPIQTHKVHINEMETLRCIGHFRLLWAVKAEIKFLQPHFCLALEGESCNFPKKKKTSGERGRTTILGQLGGVEQHRLGSDLVSFRSSCFMPSWWPWQPSWPLAPS